MIEKRIIDTIIKREREIQDHSQQQQKLDRMRKSEAVRLNVRLRRRRALSEAPKLQMHVWDGDRSIRFDTDEEISARRDAVQAAQQQSSGGVPEAPETEASSGPKKG